MYDCLIKNIMDIFQSKLLFNQVYEKDKININSSNIKADEIENNFNKRKSNIEFIDYVLTNRPYPQYKEDKDNKKVDFTKESSELYELLTERYSPNEYTTIEGDEQSQLDYFLTDHIESKLNNLKENN